MVAIFAAAWRVIIQRGRADWLILAAALLIVTLATTLLSSGPIYASAVGLSGLHRTLNDAPVAESNVQISARIVPDDVRRFDDAVVRIAGDAFAATGGPIVRVGVSDSYALPDQENVRDLAIFSFYDGIEQHATIADGRWPETASGIVETAISDASAELLGLSIGDELTLANRRDVDVHTTIRLVGIFHINDASDPFWWDDEQVLVGVKDGQSFTTYGPFIVTPATFFSSAVTPSSSQVLWRIYPVVEQLQVNEIAQLRSNVNNLGARLEADLGVRNRVAVDTDLVNILRRAERSLLVTRTGVMILTLQLAILAGYALVLTAGLLVEQRRVETALLRSRGASNGQIAAMALMEGLLLAIPAAIAGPLIAAATLRLLNVVGPLTAIELRLQPQISPLAYLLSAVAAVACVIALVLPAGLTARTFIEARSGAGREGARGFAQRGGIDLALLAIGVLGYWQLRRYGAPITETVQGRLGLDPFLVAAPAIGMLAGAVAALRIIPLGARAIDRAVVRTRGLIASLGVWQVSRRPARYARAALLLILALSIGLFAVSYTATWRRSQIDQAAFQVGSDFRVTPDLRTGTALPQWNLANGYAQIDGVQNSMPTIRDVTSVSRSAGTGQIIALEASTAPSVVHFRSDLSETAFPDLMQSLLDGRPSLPALELPGDVQRLRMTASITLDPVEGVDVQPEPPPFSLSLIVRDGTGVLYRVDTARLASQTVLEIPLASAMSQDSVAAPTSPLSIVSIDIRSIVPRAIARTGQFAIPTLAVSPTLDGDDWTPVDLGAGWVASLSSVSGLADAATIDLIAADGVPSAHISTGSVTRDILLPMVYSLRPGTIEVPATVPIVASTSFLQGTESAVGDTVQMDLGGTRRDVNIVGAIEAFPTTASNRPSIVVDLPTLQTLSYLNSGLLQPVEEWWIAVRPGSSDRVETTLDAAPFSTWKLQSGDARVQALQTDPVALGIIGALSVGFVAAALFASVGFIVSSAVSAHERLTEFALLRALGLSPRQLSGWLSLENGLLVAMSVVGGTLLGLGLAWLVLPFVTLTQSAGAVIPAVIVTIPWATILLLELAIIGLLVLVVLVSGILLRRVGLGGLLRLGEE
ncbi:MAG: FtsX-like permease family protein [Thermomicrobiales bacterium]|nr:FtsX-like permease family protein [Thermomicrobiales bacterium]